MSLTSTPAVSADSKNLTISYAQHEKEILEVIAQRDHRDEIIDALCESVLGENQREWSSAYYFEDAVTDVQERIAELEARAECRESNTSAAPVVPEGDKLDAARLEWLLYELSGKALRDINVIPASGGLDLGRIAIDAAMQATGATP